jgi:hypothetical protein
MITCSASARALVRRAWLALAAAATTVMAAQVTQAQSSRLDVVLDRLDAYLLDYETKAFELAADEDYEQWIKRRPGYGGSTVARRKLKSTYFLIRLPDGQAWYGFREVTNVDGRGVPAAQRPMAELLRERTVDAYEQAIAITRTNANYNIGGVYRTVNVPLQTLELFSQRFRGRFEFREVGRDKVKGQDTVIVSFKEKSAPSVISDGFDGDLLTHGQIWVEPTTGGVLRTELSFDGPALVAMKDTLIRVDYERDPRLQILVPRQMEERYGLDVEVVHGRATYRNYRRFETTGRLVTPN